MRKDTLVDLENGANAQRVELRNSSSVFKKCDNDTQWLKGDKKFSSDECNMTVGEYLMNNAGWYYRFLFMCCGGYHITVEIKNLNLWSGMILFWRIFMAAMVIALFVNEIQLGIEYFAFRHTLIVIAILLQFIMVIPVLLHVDKRFKCKITQYQIDTLERTLKMYGYFLYYGLFVSAVFGSALIYTGLFGFSMLRLSLEGIGYLMGTLLVTWAILFVVWDALAAECELSDFLVLAEKHELTSDQYRNAYANRYSKNEINSAGISNAIAFCAYYNLFVFVVRCLTTPESESLLITVLYCFALLSREASFLFCCFPYFASVNAEANKLVDTLSDSVWQHPNKIDTSISLCLLIIRKPYQVVILGRVVTMAEMKGQFYGVVFLTLTSMIRIIELQKYG